MGISTRFCKHFNLTPDIGQGSDTGLGTSHTPYIRSPGQTCDMWCVICDMWHVTCAYKTNCNVWPMASPGLWSPAPWASWVTSPLETNIAPRDAAHTSGLWSGGCSPPDVMSLVLMTESHDMVTHLGCHGTLSTHSPHTLVLSKY